MCLPLVSTSENLWNLFLKLMCPQMCLPKVFFPKISSIFHFFLHNPNLWNLLKLNVSPKGNFFTKISSIFFNFIFFFIPIFKNGLSRSHMKLTCSQMYSPTLFFLFLFFLPKAQWTCNLLIPCITWITRGKDAHINAFYMFFEFDTIFYYFFSFIFILLPQKGNLPKAEWTCNLLIPSVTWSTRVNDARINVFYMFSEPDRINVEVFSGSPLLAKLGKSQVCFLIPPSSVLFLFIIVII